MQPTYDPQDPQVTPTPPQVPDILPINDPTQPAYSRHVIQPISAEADIIASQATPTPQPTSEPTLTYQPVMPSAPQTPSNAPVFAVNGLPGLPPITGPKPPSKKSRIIKRSIILAVITLIVLCVLYFLFPAYFKLPISTGSLVSESVENTTFQRPKRWVPIPSYTTTYGDPVIGTGKATALVTVKENTQNSLLVNLTENFITMLRDQTSKAVSVDTISSSFGNDNQRCTSPIDFSSNIDTSTSNHVIGILAIQGICNTIDGQFKVKMRSVIGEDGRMRLIAVAASGVEWSKSGKAFDAILASIGQK